QDREPDPRRRWDRQHPAVRQTLRVRLQRDAEALDHPVHAAAEVGAADPGQRPNASTGGHVQTRFRSPYVLSIRATNGQNFPSRTQGAGKAPSSRLYGRSHSSAVTAAAVWGAFRSALFSRGTRPSSIARTWARREQRAAKRRWSWARASLSVGWITSVPATGNDIVGAWKP